MHKTQQQTTPNNNKQRHTTTHNNNTQQQQQQQQQHFLTTLQFWDPQLQNCTLMRIVALVHGPFGAFNTSGTRQQQFHNHSTTTTQTTHNDKQRPLNNTPLPRLDDRPL
jgi:hypothetical protein